MLGTSGFLLQKRGVHGFVHVSLSKLRHSVASFQSARLSRQPFQEHLHMDSRILTPPQELRQTMTRAGDQFQSDTPRGSLEALLAQAPHYATVHIHARPYLITEGDILRLPFLMPEVQPGDILRLNRASVIGSRDFTLKGAPYVDDQAFECRAVVVGVESEPMRRMRKTTRRNRRVKTVRSKHRYTELAIRELRIKELATY